MNTVLNGDRQYSFIRQINRYTVHGLAGRGHDRAQFRNRDSMKLVQKRFLKGSREFEILEDTVRVRIKTARRQDSLTVMLAVLNPEPVVNEPYLEFHSRVNGGPLLSLFLDKPDSASFDAFVDALKLRAREEYITFAGLKAGSGPEGPGANSYEEPPQVGEPEKNRKINRPVNAASIDSSIDMLEQHLDSEEIRPLLRALEALKAEPENESRLGELVNAFDDLGSRQGAVLTYAPYITVLLSDDPFGY